MLRHLDSWILGHFRTRRSLIVAGASPSVVVSTSDFCFVLSVTKLITDR